MRIRTIVVSLPFAVGLAAGCMTAQADPPTASTPGTTAGERPSWYVRRTTPRETYEASIQKKSRDQEVSFGPWYYVGPFDNPSGQGFAKEYPPERGVDLQAAYEGKDHETVRWKRNDAFHDGDTNDLAIFRNNNHFAIYLHRTIKARTATNLPVLLGSDDTLSVWLNGHKLLAVDAHRVCTLGDERLTLPLRAGDNELLLKVCQGDGPTGFAFGLSVDSTAVDDQAVFQAIELDFPGQSEALRLWLTMRDEWNRQGGRLRRDLAGRGWFRGIARYAFRPEALILDSDRDELDVVLRRTAALAAALKQTTAATKVAPLEKQLQSLTAQAAAVAVTDAEDRHQLYLSVCRLRRQIAFCNPLLDFDKLLFVKRHFLPPQEGLGNHMCDQYFGFHAVRGGGVYVLEHPLSPAPQCRNVLADSVCVNGRFEGERLEPGAFLSPSLSYDAQTILFAFTEAEPTRYRWTEKSTWHIFQVQVDGKNLTQLTDGAWNDFDPWFLPNGRVVFISERRGGFGRCHGRPVPTYTLHTMNDDGSDITCISYHETNEWHPSVNNDGMIVYTRWDYVDRGHGQAHHPWLTTPDGRDARVIQGNYGSSRPNMEMHVRAIPGSRRYVATAAAHHGQAYGSLVIVDPAIPDDDAMGPLKMLTPEAGFPESSVNNSAGLLCATAWPLSEEFFLCVYDPEGSTSRGPNNRYGIYLIDAFGNRELLYRDPQISCLSPIPLQPRKVPPVLPERSRPGAAVARGQAASPPAGDSPSTAEVGVLNVYDSLKPWPEGTKITALRIVQVLPKTTPSADNPRIGYGEQKNARRVLGTVPVDADGSAYFRLPVGKPVYFQALDEKGLAVQSMRSDTYVHPGERLMCQGCHAPSHHGVSASWHSRTALRRAPSPIRPEAEGADPFSFARLVQPVLDRHCVECHRKSDPRALELGRGDWEKNRHQWYDSYLNLEPHAFFIKDAGWTTPRTTPGQFGACASKLYQLLRQGHHELQLSADDLHRITLWLDCNSDFFGAYDQTREQAEGKVIVPALE